MVIDGPLFLSSSSIEQVNKTNSALAAAISRWTGVGSLMGCGYFDRGADQPDAVSFSFGFKNAIQCVALCLPDLCPNSGRSFVSFRTSDTG